MKRTYLSLFLAILISANPLLAQRTATKPAESPVKKQTAQNDQVPFVTKTLANGLEVIVLPDASVPIVTVELAVRNGSFTEPPELNGLSHLYEHMFFKANNATVLNFCERLVRSGRTAPGCVGPLKLKDQIGDVSYFNDLSNVGITYNGSTREEVVNYFYTTTSKYYPTAMRVINDSVRFPRFDEEDLANEKRVVIGELDRNEANPFSYLNDAMTDKLFYKYPTRKKPGGTRATVAAATSEQMRLIQSRYYFPNNAALIVAGGVKPEEVFAEAEKILGSWKPRYVNPFKEFPLVTHPPLEKSEAEIVEKQIGESSSDTDQNIFIQIGWQGPSIGKDNEATYAADVFSYILSQPDSRFQRKLVDSGLTSAASINYYTQRNVGPISLFLITTPAKANAALKSAYAEIADFSKPGYFTNAELENSKTILEANDLFDREKPSEYAHTLGFWWSSTGIDYFRGYHKNLRAVSREDIDRYVKTYIQNKPHVAIALLAPEVRGAAALTDESLIGK